MKDKKRLLVNAAIIIALSAVMYLAISVTSAVGVTTYQEQYLPGRPLDAVKMSAPTFSDKSYCYKVADRTSGACWWLLHVDGQWVELPVCEGASYVRQQQEQAPAKAGE